MAYHPETDEYDVPGGTATGEQMRENAAGVVSLATKTLLEVLLPKKQPRGYGPHREDFTDEAWERMGR